MRTFKVWERAVYKSRDIEAENIYSAVREFARAPITNLSSAQYLACSTGKSNPARFITSDGTAREFTAYEVQDNA